MDVWNSLRAREFQRVARIERAQASEREQQAARARASTAPEATTSVAISEPAELLSSLSAFQQSDGKRFQEVLGAVASNLKAAANSPSGEIGADLGHLADKLMAAANSGNLSRLASGFQTGRAHHAIEAYRRNLPPQSQTVRDALEYVQIAVRDAG